MNSVPRWRVCLLMVLLASSPGLVVAGGQQDTAATKQTVHRQQRPGHTAVASANFLATNARRRPPLRWKKWGTP